MILRRLAVGTRWRIAEDAIIEWFKGNIHSRSSEVAQNRELDLARYNRHVLFLVPGVNQVNGGIMSILSIARETSRYFQSQPVAVAVVTGPRNAPLRKFTKFDNDWDLIPFAKAIYEIKDGSTVLVQVPEYAVQAMILNKLQFFKRKKISWQFNILLQNIDLIPKRADIFALRKMGSVTATVAHAAYANENTAIQIGCPVHFLSTWVCAEEFQRTPHAKKQRIIVVSPDEHVRKREVMRVIADTLPDHKIVEIRGMTYRKYRELILSAKFSFTFGEGLDGYLIEEIFSGGIGMAFYNDRFFTPDYKSLDGVFPESNGSLSVIAEFLKQSNDPQRYDTVAARQYAMLSRKYVRAEYLSNLRLFYETYFPG